MTEKRLTVVLYGCDRNLWRGGALRIRVSDVFAAGGPRLLYQGRTEAATVDIRLPLPFDAGQVYGFTFSAPGHRPAWQLVRRADFIRVPENIEGDSLILRLMLVPDSAGTSDVPQGFGRLQRRASPLVAPGTGLAEGVFQPLAVAAQMAFLNIEAKLRETYVDARPLLSFVRGVRHVAVDRLFLFFDADLKDRLARAADFGAAPGHGAPASLPDLPAHPDSWKHRRHAEGNVQLSFSLDPIAMPGGGGPSPVHSADVDIDLGKGLAHVVEWLENNVFRPGHKTNQSLVYALLYAQGILPVYELDPAPATRRSAPVRLGRVPSKGTGRTRRPLRKRRTGVARKKSRR